MATIFVLADALDPRQEGGVLQISLRVLPRENFINAKDQLSVPANYWADWHRWGVVVDAAGLHNEPRLCPVPLITDGGESLILLHVGPGFSADDPVLQIYRRQDHPGDPIREGADHGVFISEIAMTKSGRPDTLARNLGVRNDETPQWFPGGTFEFSSDYRQLIHKTRCGNTVRNNWPTDLCQTSSDTRVLPESPHC
jgi:hypothetical protein